MPIIPQSDAQKLQELFAQELVDEVPMFLFVRPESRLMIPGRQPTTSNEARQLMEELASLSEKLQLRIHDVTAEPEAATEHRVDKLPALLLVGPEGANVRFFGLPSGYEFATLVGDILDISKGEVQLSEQTRLELATLDQEVHLQVFVTPT